MLLYVIELNGKFYVGITSRSFNKRFSEHISLSKTDIKSHFHNALRKITTVDVLSVVKRILYTKKTDE